MGLTRENIQYFGFQSIIVSGSAAGSGSGSFYRTGLKDEIFTFSEDVKKSERELADASEASARYGRKVTGEFTIEEINTDDISNISEGNNIKFLSSEGGANGNGRYLQISGSQDDCTVEAVLDGFGMKVTVTNTTNAYATLPYSAGSNA